MPQVNDEPANKSAMHYDVIAPTSSPERKYMVACRPAAVWLQPAEEKLHFTYHNGYVHVRVPPVTVHTIIETKPAP